MASTRLLQERISALMLDGASLDRVEDEVIEPCGLSSDQKAALWLYAWSHLAGAEQRTQAAGYLANLN